MSESPDSQTSTFVAAGSRSVGTSGARLFILAVGAGCVALVVFLLLGLSVPAAVAKVVASTSFVFLAIRAGATEAAYGRIILLGLVFSWFGDVFLIGGTQAAFLAGLVAFLLAHCAYIAAFGVRGINVQWAVVAALPVAAIGVLVSLWLTPHLPAELVIPVRVYTLVISLMVVMAFGTRGTGASMLILAGAVLFFLSDLSVAALRLVQTEFPTYVWGLPLYYAGQVCLALSSSNGRSCRTKASDSFSAKFPQAGR